MSRRYKALLLDADDTVFDFREAERRAFLATTAPLGLNAPEHCAAYHAINKRYWRALEQGLVTQEQLRVGRFEDLLRQYGVDADATQVAWTYSHNLSMQGVLIDGALEAVRQIAQVMPVAVVTNGISDVQRGRMARSSIREFISALVISQEVGAAKPDPQMLYVALEKLGGLSPKDVIMAGDSPSSDVRAANAAGIDMCWYNAAEKMLPEGLHVEYEIREIGSLPQIVLQNA